MGKLKILTVEDDQEFREQFKKTVHLCYYDTLYAEADNGRLGLQKAGLQDFDVIFLDLDIPLRSGIEFIRIFKTSYVRKNINNKNTNQFLPIVIMTASIDENSVREAITLGVKNILVKPFDDKDVKEAIMKVTKITNPDIYKAMH